jgi:hypothetical protein
MLSRIHLKAEATFTNATISIVPSMTDHISQATAEFSAVTIGGSTYTTEQ